MLITRTPLVLTLCGGETDLPEFYKHNEYGAVCSLAVNKYVYIAAKEASPELSVEAENYDQVSMEDCPNMLGRGCAFAVGQVNARALVLDMTVLEKEKLALRAASLGNGPKGLYYGAAFGGLTYFEFSATGSVGVNPLVLDAKREREFMDHLLLFHTGPNTEPKPLSLKELSRERAKAQACSVAWTQGTPKEFGSLLEQSRFTEEHGAYGWKTFGEYLLVVAPPEAHAKVLEVTPNRHIPFAIDWKGSVSFYTGE